MNKKYVLSLASLALLVSVFQVFASTPEKRADDKICVVIGRWSAVTATAERMARPHFF